jgi:hypothetical protein
MAYQRIDFPALTSEHLASAKIFSNRYDMIKNIELPDNAIVTEVGVAHGEFSEYLLQEIKPSKFVAIDLFEMEKYPVHWGIPQEVLLDGLPHLEYYQKRFQNYKHIIQIEQGLSHDCLARMPDNHFDLVYIDAGHDYENVKRDGEIAQDKIRKKGIIIFNDYIMYDPFIESEYGVVQAVNEILNEGGWKVVYFALEKNLFCDIAIIRS